MLGRMPYEALAQTGVTSGMIYPRGGDMSMFGGGYAPNQPQMSPYSNAGIGGMLGGIGGVGIPSMMDAYNQATGKEKEGSGGNPLLDMAFKTAMSNWMNIPSLGGASATSGLGSAGASAMANAAAGSVPMSGAGSAGASTGMLGGLAGMAPAMMWALPAIAAAGGLSLDATARGATGGDLAKWWAGPVGNLAEGNIEGAIDGGMKMVGGPISAAWDIANQKPWWDVLATSMGGPVGGALAGLISGEPSENIIQRLSGFGKKKKK